MLLTTETCGGVDCDGCEEYGCSINQFLERPVSTQHLCRQDIFHAGEWYAQSYYNFGNNVTDNNIYMKVMMTQPSLLIMLQV